jgi:hypothetical protein
MVELEPASPGNELSEALQQLGLSTHDLWVGYFAVGGNGALSDVEGWLSGDDEVPRLEHNLLAQALNDRFTLGGLNHPVSYRDLPPPPPQGSAGLSPGPLFTAMSVPIY